MPVSALPLSSQAASWFHALSDETRVEIVGMLSHGERCVCELMASLDAAQSRLSFHLRTLRDAGVVSDRREGRWMYYRLNQDALDGMNEFLRSVQPGQHAGSCRVACCEPTPEEQT